MKNKDLLEAFKDRSPRYVDSAELSLNHNLDVGETFLDFFQVDACAGKLYLSQNTPVVAVGFTSNFQIIPLTYVWQFCSESTETWTLSLSISSRNTPGSP